ncbi:hypothetical protein IE53DRAFT_369520 [Violaceomyces palustris]|uniref:Uncharacterized protein n=1 Tax=Violaceomyces palustris TaxID=1673888 RepID=A0ACD0NV48_9BASI|nr:hypothetical protein IE53DRAFT_369520 [Violaceomyces palustris]
MSHQAEPGTKSKLTPSDIVDEFKRQGHFDEMRKALLQSFQSGGLKRPLMERIEELLVSKVEEDHSRLSSRDSRLQHDALMREIDRFPVFDRLMEDLKKEDNHEDGDHDRLLEDQLVGGDEREGGKLMNEGEERGGGKGLLAPNGLIGKGVQSRVENLVAVATKGEREEDEGGGGEAEMEVGE